MKKKKEKKLINIDFNWVVILTISAFIISFIFSFLSEILLSRADLIISSMIVLIFIFIGVIFDMIGVAVTTAHEKPFHSMSAKKIYGSNEAIKLLKNQERVSSFCNDVIGDICGIISGSASIYIATNFTSILKIDLFLITLLVTALVSSLTIGLKAIGKSVALNHNVSIVLKTAKVITYIKKLKK